MMALRRIARSLWSFWQQGRSVERAGYLIGALLLVSGVIHLAVLSTGGGTWMGPLSLRKPTTFGLSFGLTLITIAWVSSFLRLGDRARSLLLGIFTVACVMETALVMLQAWRGVPSHFNLETTFDGAVARMLAAGGFTLVVIVAVMTLVSFRANPTISPSLRIAIRIGFGALLGSLVVGALMIADGMALVFAGDFQAAYATGGTFKPTHAVTMHAILVLPFLAWLLSLTDWSERRRLRIVLLATAGYAAFAGVVAAGNLAGLEPSRMPIVTIAIAAAGMLVLMAAGVIALVGVARSSARQHVATAFSGEVGPRTTRL
jgi:hypothetical protein